MEQPTPGPWTPQHLMALLERQGITLTDADATVVASRIGSVMAQLQALHALPLDTNTDEPAFTFRPGEAP